MRVCVRVCVCVCVFSKMRMVLNFAIGIYLILEDASSNSTNVIWALHVLKLKNYRIYLRTSLSELFGLK